MKIMSEKIQNYINKLEEPEYRQIDIDDDMGTDEMDDVEDILDKIKSISTSRNTSKKQIERIMDFLNHHITHSPGGRYELLNSFQNYKEDFQKLSLKYNNEYSIIKNNSKKNTNQIIDQLIAEGVITDETTKIKPRIKANTEIIALEKLEKGYTVKKNDWLSLLTKGLKIKFYKEADKIWPGDTITIKGADLIRTHRGKNVVVGKYLGYIKPTVDGPTVDGPTVDGPTVDGPTVDGPTVDGPTVDGPTVDGPTVESLKYETKKYTIETSPLGYSMLGANGEKMYFPKPKFERSNLKGEGLVKYNALKEVLDIWNTSAIKVATNDAFQDSTKKNINDAVVKISNLLKLSTNENFTSKIAYDSLINDIFKIIIETEDNERDIIDEEDMLVVKGLLLSIDSKKSKESMLSIYSRMRNSLGIFDDGDNSEVKEKISAKLLKEQEFKYISEIIEQISNTKGELTEGKIETYLDNNPTTKGNENLRKNIINSFLELKKGQNEQSEAIKNGYPTFCQQNNIDINTFSVSDYKNLIIKDVFSKNIKHLILRSHMELLSDRGDDKTTLKGMYADIVGLGEEKGGLELLDYISIADSNIDWTKEVGLTVATSLLPAGGVYMGIAKLTSMGLKAYKGGKIGKTAINTTGFVGRNTAAYSASIGYEGWKNDNYGEMWNIKSLGEFMALDGVMSAAFRGANFIKKGEGYTIKEKTILKFDNIWKRALPSLAVLGTSTEAMVNIPKLLHGKDITLMPGDWTEDDIVLVMMFAAMHGAGKFKFTAKKGKDNKIDIEGTKPYSEKEVLRKKAKLDEEAGVFDSKPNKLEFLKGPDGKRFKKRTIDGVEYIIDHKGNQEIISLMKEKLKQAKIRDDGKNTIFTENIKKLEEKINYYESLQIVKPKIKKVNTKDEPNETILETSTTKSSIDYTNKNPLSFINKEFRKIFDKTFKTDNTVEFKNQFGEKLKISKTSDSKYKIEGDNSIYTRRDILSKLDSSYRKVSLKEKALSDIKTIKDGHEINIAKTFGLPYTGKVQILKNGEIRLKTKDGWKSLGKEAQKQLFKNEKIVKMILEKDLSNISNNLIKRFLNKEQRAELLKENKMDLFKGILETNLLTYGTMIGVPFLLDPFINLDTGSKTTDFGLELGGSVMAGYIVGTIANVAFKGPLRIAGLGASYIKKGYNSIDGYKLPIVGLSALATTGTIVYNEFNESSKQTNP